MKLTEIMKGKEKVNYFPDSNRLGEIMLVVSAHSGIPEDDIRRKTRKREIVYARQLFSYFACKVAKLPLETISDYVYEGYKHTSIIYGRNTIIDLMFSDKKVKLDVDQIAKTLTNGNKGSSN